MIGQNFFFFIKINLLWSFDGCGDGRQWSHGGTSLVFSFPLFQSHRSGFCGVLFDFCRFGLWFLSFEFFIPLYVLRVFFFFWKIYMLFGLISIGSGFWFLCNCVLQIFYVLVLFVLQIRNHPTAPTRSSNDSSHRVRPNVRVVVGLFFVHPIWSGQVQVKPKPDPTRPVDKTM